MKKQNIIVTFIIPIIAIIALLAVQALCDLELPSYTSDIINNGIQQGGIDRGLPEALTVDMFDAIVRISDEDPAIMVSYDLYVTENLSSGELESLSEDYPLLKEENLYLLNNLTDEEKDIVEEKMKMPLIIATMLYSNNESLMTSLNLEVPEGSTLLDIVLSMDDNTFNMIISSIEESLESLDISILDGYAVSSVNTIYHEIGMDMDNYQINYIIDKGLIMLGIAGAGMIIAIIVGYLIAKLAAKIGYVLRSKVVRKIMSFSSSEFKEFGASSLITRSTNDIEQIKMFFIMLLRIVVFAPIMGIGAFIKVSDNPLNWIIGLALIIIFILIGILFGFAMPKFKSMQKLIDKMNLVSREIITGMPVIRTFGTEKHEEERFDKANVKLTKTNLFVNRLMGIMLPSMMLVMNIISILIVWYGAEQIDIGTLQVGTLLAFISYTMQIIMSFLMISLVSVMLPRALVSLKRIKEILKKEVSIVELENPVPFKEDEKGVIEFKNVSFKYPDADEVMLKNISFKATPGTTTAFIGSTGSGKSTLINLIPRFFDATSGEVIVDGVNIKEASVVELRNKIGYVPQKGMLFSGTIKSNLMLGNDNLTDSEMLDAARVSQSLEFINEKKDKFDSEISQGGSNVSGGQKQRLSIARAIAKNPEIYIFDDSFSALDYKTDKALRDELNTKLKDKTKIIVAQRIGTIRSADKIIVLDEGEIKGIGSHLELLDSCDVYKEIAKSQLSEEELAHA